MATLDTFQPNLKIEKKPLWKNFLHFSKKQLLYFRKWNVPAPSLKNSFLKKIFTVFQGGTFKAWKIKKITLKKFVIFCHILGWLLIKPQNKKYLISGWLLINRKIKIYILWDDYWLKVKWKKFSSNGMTTDLVCLVSFSKNIKRCFSH